MSLNEVSTNIGTFFFLSFLLSSRLFVAVKGTTPRQPCNLLISCFSFIKISDFSLDKTNPLYLQICQFYENSIKRLQITKLIKLIMFSNGGSLKTLNHLKNILRHLFKVLRINATDH